MDKVDVGKNYSSADYKSVIDQLEKDIGVLHRQTKSMNVPVIIVFEGWDASGKAVTINNLLFAMDPRNYTVHPIYPATEEERMRPYLWRFWTKIPPRGHIALFDRSWYHRVAEDRVTEEVAEKRWKAAYDEINHFERQLTDDGYVILKYFLHITKEEQVARLEKIKNQPDKAWRYRATDWEHPKKYDEYFQAYDDMLTKTDTRQAPWIIVPSHDFRYANYKVLQNLKSAFQRRAVELSELKKPKPKAKERKPGKIPSVLDKVDLSPGMSREKYDQQLEKYQSRLFELSLDVHQRNLPVVVVYEGWDAAGKGGSIRRVVQRIDPRIYKVIPIIKPNEVEYQYHYLWRFWKEMPPAGRLTIFDRSWYGRVMVERIEGFCCEEEWRRAYGEINEMEKEWTNFGTLLIKFWMHIDKETQLKRFTARMNNPHKNWKISDEDWKNRAKWDDYYRAVDEMLHRTSTSHAPWTVVESNNKLFARIKTLKTIVNGIENKF